MYHYIWIIPQLVKIKVIDSEILFPSMFLHNLIFQGEISIRSITKKIMS